MRLPKKSLIIALGGILAAATGLSAAPQERFERGNGYYAARGGESMEQRGRELIREGERLERMGYYRRGVELEREGRMLLRQGEQRERGTQHRDWR